MQKKGFKSGMKERVGDEKLIIIIVISVAVRGINDHIRFYSQMLCTPLTPQEHRPVPPNADPAVWILSRVVV